MRPGREPRRVGAGDDRAGQRSHHRPHGLVLFLCLFGCAGPAVIAAEQAPDDLLGPYMPYAAFDAMPARQFRAAGACLRVAFAGDFAPAVVDAALAWTRDAAVAVGAYLGRYPVDFQRVLFVAMPGSTVHGTSWGYHGAAIRIPLGREVAPEKLRANWVMTHEMLHMAVPSLPERHLWFDEGLATYVEPVARAQQHALTAEAVWTEWIDGMPKGMPRPGDRGLDLTHTWGRTYWGGALFFLLAEVEMRSRSANRVGLQQALRELGRRGADKEHDWSIEQTIAAADQGTGMQVLAGMYARMRASPAPPDLDGLFARLGVRRTGSGIEFDDSAPLADIRRSITAAPEERPTPLDDRPGDGRCKESGAPDD